MKKIVCTFILICITVILTQYITVHNIEVHNITDDTITLKINNQYEVYSYMKGVD